MSAVFSWGSDIYGRLGHGTEDKHIQTPTEVKSLTDVSLKQVTCGSAHNIAIDIDGVCYTWGKCHYGQLGHGEQDRDEHSPRPVDALKGITVTSITGGDSHVLAITDLGRIYSWGQGYYGTLGHGDEVSLALPKLIEGLSEPDVFIVQGTAGANHNLVQSNDGKVYVWGRDQCGQLDLPTQKIMITPGVVKEIRLTQKVPVIKPFTEAVKMISACFNHTLVLLESGNIISFGFNEHGELGRQTDHIIDPAHFKESVIYVTAGWKHCAAITVSGSLYTWGHGSYGRLGVGHSRDVTIPTLVKGLPSCQDVSCGESHTIALDTTGQLWGWGSGHYGKLGLPLDEISFIEAPRVLSFVSPSGSLTGVSCGTNHSLAHTIQQN